MGRQRPHGTGDRDPRPDRQAVTRRRHTSDGADFVSLHLINLSGAPVGGVTEVHTPDGELLLSTRLTSRLDSLFLNDRRLLHDITPIAAVVGTAHYDVLLIAYRTARPESRPPATSDGFVVPTHARRPAPHRRRYPIVRRSPHDRELCIRPGRHSRVDGQTVAPVKARCHEDRCGCRERAEGGPCRRLGGVDTGRVVRLALARRACLATPGCRGMSAAACPPRPRRTLMIERSYC